MIYITNVLPVMQQSADQTLPVVAVVSACSFPYLAVHFSVWFGTSVGSDALGFGPTHSVGYKN